MKIGDVIRVIRNTNGNNYTIGRKYALISSNSPTQWQARDIETGWIGNNILESDMVIAAYDKNDINKRLKEMDEEKEKYNLMLTYMEEENKEEVDPSELFAWHIIKVLESNDPKKKDKIAKLLTTMSNNIDIDVITKHR